MAKPIEAVIIEYLNADTGFIEDGIKAYAQEPFNEKPSQYPGKFIVVEKTGSSCSDYLYSSMIAVQSYAPTVYDASCLSERVIEAMDGLTDLDRITGVGLNSNYVFNKTSTKQPRYQAVFDISHY